MTEMPEMDGILEVVTFRRRGVAEIAEAMWVPSYGKADVRFASEGVEVLLEEEPERPVFEGNRRARRKAAAQARKGVAVMPRGWCRPTNPRCDRGRAGPNDGGANMIPEIRDQIRSIALYQAAEFRGDMLRLGMAAMMGSEAAAEAIAQATADVVIEHALDPDAPGVSERYQATCEATILSSLVKPVGRDADLPAVGSFA